MAMNKQLQLEYSMQTDRRNKKDIVNADVIIHALCAKSSINHTLVANYTEETKTQKKARARPDHMRKFLISKVDSSDTHMYNHMHMSNAHSRYT